ncbi:MAG: ATP-binding protein, partial [Cytophagaceae bacterium]|nr:ATP-binding protein [Cytophagaceae bacterium]
MPTDVVIKSPFKFLDAYTSRDRDRFFGRQAEQKRLVELLFSSRLILVYGASGTGKSSLVQCGLAQVLSEADYFPVIVRRRGDLPTSLRSTLQSFFEDDDQPDSSDAADLVGQLSGYILRPVYLIFDQFEELFISGSADEQRAFLNQLKTIHGMGGSGKVVLILREEYLAHLYPFEEELPSLFDFRLRVEPMSERNLEAVIVGTCRSVEGVVLEREKETARLIIANNQGARSTFQLPYLQVYLDRLWRLGLQKQTLSGGANVVIGPDLVGEVGAIDDVLERFLAEQKKAVAESLPPERQAAVGTVLEAFVTYEGTRREHTLPTLLTETALDPPVLVEILRQLESVRILREDEGRFELPHDSLARLIDQGRSAEQRQINDIVRRLKDAYREYSEKGRAEDLLLPARRVAEVELHETVLKTELAKGGTDSPALWQFVQASRALLQKQQQAELEEQRRKNRRLRRWVVVAGVVLVLTLGAGVAVYNLWETSKQAVASMGAALNQVKLQEISALQKKARSYEEYQEYD